jgi:hypothetical protein
MIKEELDRLFKRLVISFLIGLSANLGCNLDTIDEGIST